jgi:hypothetical protein
MTAPPSPSPRPRHLPCPGMPPQVLPPSPSPYPRRMASKTVQGGRRCTDVATGGRWTAAGGALEVFFQLRRRYSSNYSTWIIHPNYTIQNIMILLWIYCFTLDYIKNFKKGITTPFLTALVPSILEVSGGIMVHMGPPNIDNLMPPYAFLVDTSQRLCLHSRRIARHEQSKFPSTIVKKILSMFDQIYTKYVNICTMHN